MASPVHLLTLGLTRLKLLPVFRGEIDHGLDNVVEECLGVLVFFSLPHGGGLSIAKSDLSVGVHDDFV